ncbi:MAG: nuclear transport factor 2 family protein [Sphingopyxis terrae]|uniref:nuclear transport factor 2 family protein n=1 Tax=Sphingopyxis terrae TaxID=33052 RepID=UPI0007898F45|nr:nuclear transport factor 2 family protein [Sphingopyxis terrae]MDX8356628.1 nuclear transport factor 2 family protein [Sphingopyxis terrae]
MSAGSDVHPGLAAWHAYMAAGGEPETLRAMLADDAVFHSPVVHSPQEGRDKVFAYLHAASHVLGGDNFRYLREIADGNQACLEFATELEGIHINGVDIIRWNDDGKIQDFKVMVRPLKAINKVWEKMAAMLAAQAG